MISQNWINSRLLFHEKKFRTLFKGWPLSSTNTSILTPNFDVQNDFFKCLTKSLFLISKKVWVLDLIILHLWSKWLLWEHCGQGWKGKKFRISVVIFLIMMTPKTDFVWGCHHSYAQKTRLGILIMMLQQRFSAISALRAICLLQKFPRLYPWNAHLVRR